MALPTGTILSEGSLIRSALPLADDAAMAFRNSHIVGKSHEQKNQSGVAAQKPDTSETNILETAAPVVNTVGTVASIGGMAGLLVPIAAGMGWVAEKILGGKTIGGFLKAPWNFFGKPSELRFTKKEYRTELKPTRGMDLLNAAGVVGSTVQTFNVARSYAQKRAILKMIRADMVADKAARHSENSEKDAAPLADSVKHVFMEHGLRGLMALAGLAISWRMMRYGKFNMVTGMLLPMLAEKGIDLFMGENELVNAYAPFKEMQMHGQATQQSYAAFLVAVSKDLSSRGALAQPAAMKLAEHYAAAKASPARILNDIADGEFKKLLKNAVVAVDAERSHAAPPVNHAPAAHGRAMDGRMNPDKNIEVKGKHTGREALRRNAPATEHGAPPPVP